MIQFRIARNTPFLRSVQATAPNFVNQRILSPRLSVFSRIMSTIQYPKLRRDDVVDDLHGHKVPDPYRWLENPQSEDTKVLLPSSQKDLNALFEEYIEKFPHTQEYRESLTNMYNYERFNAPFRVGKHWYYSYNEGLKAQAVYYTLDEKALEAREKGDVFFDPNTLSEDGTISLNTHRFSKDGTLYAYAVSQSGSDWCKAKIRKVESRQDYPETLEWLKFTALVFTHDNKGVFYSRYPEPMGTKDEGTETDANRNQMLYYHILGTDQSEDVLIHRNPENPEWSSYIFVTWHGDYMCLDTSRDTAPANKFWIAKVKDGVLPADRKLDWIKIKDDFDSGLSYVANNGSIFYFESNLNTPKGSLVRYDLDHPEKGFVTIIPEQKTAVLESVSLASEKYLVLRYLHNVQSKLFVLPLESAERSAHEKLAAETPSEWIGLTDAEQIALPIGCNVQDLSCHRDESRMFIRCVGFTLAGRIYEYQFKDPGNSHENGSIHHVPPSLKPKDKSFGNLSVWREAVVNGFEPDQWAVEQVWVPNPNDGIKVPMFIVRDKTLVKTGDSFCYLYGYGGFSISITPAFSPTIAAMLTHTNGLYCVANIRGGGEFGEDWHNAAVRDKRHVAFADFEECGRYLIREGWTKKERLACEGASNGGALVGAVMNRAGEEVFGAGVARVGVLDMLRYHLFTIGYAWKPDYGDPDVKEDFEFIYKWSPYHNVRDGANYQYPAVLLETSDHDDRVVPLHSFKYTAALQYSAGETNKAPLLLRHHVKAGHGAGKPTKKVIEEASERFAFMMRATQTTFVPRVQISRYSRM